jgi:capsular exopolysaccharide synthesis family protein
MDRQLDTRNTLHDYIAVVGRSKWLVLTAVVLVPLIAFLLTQTQDPRYTSSATVLLNRQSLAATVTGGQDPNIFQDPELLGRTQAQVARVPEVARRALAAAEIDSRSPGELLGASSVETVPQTDVVLRFNVSDRFPEVAQVLATAYARQYTLYRRDLDTAAYKAAQRELRQQMAKLRASGVDTQSSLYSNLLEKHQNLSTLVALQVSNASLLREAVGASQTSPRMKFNVALGLFLGIVIGLGIAFLREALDRRVRADQDLGTLIDLPLLGRLAAPPKQADVRQLAMTSRPATPEAESFRLLRANLELANLDRHARTIMVTSASPKEGKTTTISNLAVAMASAGRSVALVDLDLRDPALGRIFGLQMRAGVTQVVLGDVSLEEALARVPLASAEIGPSGRAPVTAGTLDVLPAGSIPPNPADVAASAGVADILRQLGESHDVVLIDAPPLLVVSDALTLGARVDAVVVVVRLYVMDRDTLEQLARALDSVPSTKLGYVLTGAEMPEGYGYGYGARATPERPPSSGRSSGAARTRPVEVVEPTLNARTSESSRG